MSRSKPASVLMGICVLLLSWPPGHAQAPRADSPRTEAGSANETNSPPAWQPGYKIRYTLQVVEDPLSLTSRTVMARLPLGAWLRPDAEDLLVMAADGKPLPVAVLSHNPKGETIVQFNRHNNDRFYWVYVCGPQAPAAIEPTLVKKIAEAKAAAAEALKSKIDTQMIVGKRADELRNTVDQIARKRKTIADATSEIAAWNKLLPQRTAAAETAAGKIPAGVLALEQATIAFQATKAKAAEEMAAARKTMAEAAAAEKTLPLRMAAAKAEGEKSAAEKKLAELNAAAAQARKAVDEAQVASTQAATLKTNAEHSISLLTPEIPTREQSLAAARTNAVTAVETARVKSEEYRRLAAGADPTLHQEGLTVEFREWAGAELGDWGVVVAGLRQSTNVLGNAMVSEVIQHLNPTRRSNPRNFSAAYRGYLKIDKPGVCRFFVNGDDSAFLFIDGYRVYAREGTNRPLSGNTGVYSIGVDLELEPGVHQCEIYSVISNSPAASGLCNFLWLPPGTGEWSHVPPSAFTRAMLAQVSQIEAATSGQLAVFYYGIDDVLRSDGITLYLVRFEASGQIARPEKLIWNFGDGTSGSGRSVSHVYLRKGDYEVALQSAADLRVFQRRIHVWDAPAPSSPYSLPAAVEVLGGMDLAKLDPQSRHDIFGFLMICEEPGRWPVLERLSRLLLAQPGLDIQYRMIIYASLMEAIAQQGRGAAALELENRALAEIPGLKILQLGIMLKAADICRVHLKDFEAADRRYEKMMSENKKLVHPFLRQAAISWGDMFLAAGDLGRAGDAYRLATTLGTKSPLGEKQTDAVTRGALLRVAEQQLKNGNTHQTRRLLQRIETEFPEEKLEGLYRFLCGETERHAGRYEEALGNYEVLLNLRQWAGFRAAALYGLADTYSRMGNFDKALEWLQGLERSFPAFYAERKLADYQALIEGRRKRIQEPDAAGSNDVALGEYQTGFEPHENPPPLAPEGFRIVPSGGIAGPYVALKETSGVPSGKKLFSINLRNIISGGTFWVEFWYRNTLTPAEVLVSPQVQAEFHGSDNRLSSQQTVYLERTYGAWQKAAFRLPVPLTQDGKITLAFNNLIGLWEVDGLKILPISDRQNEAWRSFIEGADPP